MSNHEHSHPVLAKLIATPWPRASASDATLLKSAWLERSAKNELDFTPGKHSVAASTSSIVMPIRMTVGNGMTEVTHGVKNASCVAYSETKGRVEAGEGVRECGQT